MAIRLLYLRGKYIPLFVCDQCGKRIEDARQALEISDATTSLKDGDMTNVFHVHKGACDQAMEAKLGPTGSNELTDHVFQLAYNVGLRQRDFTAFDQRAKMWDQLG